MKRLHVNVAVNDIAESVRFYSVLFGAGPVVQEPDYAKWMLEDPRVNFAISTHGTIRGLDHLGIQVEDKAELEAVSGALKAAGAAVFDQGETTCCYAKSDKAWVRDPQGIAWETFLTHGRSTTYGDSAALPAAASVVMSDAAQSCCAPAADPQPKSACCG
ncbi:ArsI/CadI family heavy metal resistance metalloenzyme [Ferrovibrio sp.]|uniref:ArsI/CadI family heavy metal resistance metalloenzyme n=1 Tax=Ferrovibrio sp. TaxID=1917215 RepID=UPI00311D62BF